MIDDDFLVPQVLANVSGKKCRVARIEEEDEGVRGPVTAICLG